MLGLDPQDERAATARALSTLPHRLGGLGLRDACRTSEAAYWAAVADALPVLRQRLPELAERALAQLEQPGGATAQGIQAAREAAAQLARDGYHDRPECTTANGRSSQRPLSRGNGPTVGSTTPDPHAKPPRWSAKCCQTWT